MNALQVLPSLAEVSLGVIGFSGILVVLGRHEGHLSELERFRISQLLIPSAAAFFASLIPIAVHETGVPTFTTWRLCSALLGLYSLFWVLTIVPRSRHMSKRVPGLFHWPTFNSLVAGHLANFLLQLLNVSGVMVQPLPGIYLFGIIFLLVNAIIQFTRMLFYQFNLDAMDESATPGESRHED